MIDPETVARLERAVNEAKTTHPLTGDLTPWGKRDVYASDLAALIEDWRTATGQNEERLQARLTEYEAENKRLRKAMEEAVALLEANQWGGNAMCSYDCDESHLVCPYCGGHEPIELNTLMTPLERKHWKRGMGHRPGCELAAFLASRTLGKEEQQ